MSSVSEFYLSSFNLRAPRGGAAFIRNTDLHSIIDLKLKPRTGLCVLCFSVFVIL